MVADEASVSSPNLSARADNGGTTAHSTGSDTQVLTITLTLALFSLNFHLYCKYVARFIVVIKNILKVFPRTKQASSLYHLNRFFAIKGVLGNQLLT